MKCKHLRRVKYCACIVLLQVFDIQHCSRDFYINEYLQGFSPKFDNGGNPRIRGAYFTALFKRFLAGLPAGFHTLCPRLLLRAHISAMRWQLQPSNNGPCFSVTNINSLSFPHIVLWCHHHSIYSLFIFNFCWMNTFIYTYLLPC